MLMRPFLLGLGVAMCILCTATSSRADDRQGRRDRRRNDDSEVFLLPPDPKLQPPSIAIQIHAEALSPVATRAICPGGARCVLGGGGGVGGVLERRAPWGFALGLGYDAFFLDGNGVYELSVLQAFRVGVRYRFLRERSIHPYVGVGFGALIFGDTFRANTVGGVLSTELGAEFELGGTLSFVAALTARMFSVKEFVSTGDDVQRAADFGINAMVGLQLGVVLLRPPRVRSGPARLLR